MPADSKVKHHLPPKRLRARWTTFRRASAGEQGTPSDTPEELLVGPKSAWRTG